MTNHVTINLKVTINIKVAKLRINFTVTRVTMNIIVIKVAINIKIIKLIINIKVAISIKVREMGSNNMAVKDTASIPTVI